MDHKTKFTLEKAEERLSQAKEELCKPQEDVVSYSVCQNAFYAIKNYLGSFLNENKVGFEESESVEELLKKCRSLDKRFNELHLAPLYHPTETEHIWMNIDTANDYVEMAERTRQMFSKV
jgi:HEPN domain-containing protein